MLCGAVGLVACVGATEPNRENCFAVGDTVAFSVVSLSGVAIVCDWTIQKTTLCKTHPVQRYGQADCMEGEKYPRR